MRTEPVTRSYTVPVSAPMHDEPHRLQILAPPMIPAHLSQRLIGGRVVLEDRDTFLPPSSAGLDAFGDPVVLVEALPSAQLMDELGHGHVARATNHLESKLGPCILVRDDGTDDDVETGVLRRE